jgi:dynein heavy chain 1
MEIVSPASPANGVASTSLPAIDPVLVVEHLAEVLKVTLGATRKDLESLGSLLSKSRYSETVSRCTRFATESQLALYVQKDVVDQPDGVVDISGQYCILYHSIFTNIYSQNPYLIAIHLRMISRPCHPRLLR